MNYLGYMTGIEIGYDNDGHLTVQSIVGSNGNTVYSASDSLNAIVLLRILSYLSTLLRESLGLLPIDHLLHFLIEC